MTPETIVNLTQHEATPDQIAAGVVEPSENKKAIIKTLTFEEIPSRAEIYDRAMLLASYAASELMQPPEGCSEAGFEEWSLPDDAAAMIAGAPYLMSLALSRSTPSRSVKV